MSNYIYILLIVNIHKAEIKILSKFSISRTSHSFGDREAFFILRSLSGGSEEKVH